MAGVDMSCTITAGHHSPWILNGYNALGSKSFVAPGETSVLGPLRRKPTLCAHNFLRLEIGLNTGH